MRVFFCLFLFLCVDKNFKLIKKQKKNPSENMNFEIINIFWTNDKIIIEKVLPSKCTLFFFSYRGLGDYDFKMQKNVTFIEITNVVIIFYTVRTLFSESEILKSKRSYIWFFMGCMGRLILIIFQIQNVFLQHARTQN